MLTGERPPGAELPSSLRPDVPRLLDEVFRRCYTRRDRRIASARLILDVLAPQPSEWRPAASGATGGIPAPPISQVGARCPSCGGEVHEDDQFCIYCGAQLAARVARCDACGAYVHPSDKFCILCGKDLRVMNA
jgi:hypothetical protein